MGHITCGNLLDKTMRSRDRGGCWGLPVKLAVKRK